MAAISGIAGSLSLNLPSACTCSTFTLGATTPALKGLVKGEAVELVQAPLGLAAPISGFLGTEVFGRGLR